MCVSANQVAFALGTDTAGSGRVPASFNNIVGLKPTRGVVTSRGMFPACRSLDCLSVFALTTQDAWDVFTLMKVGFLFFIFLKFVFYLIYYLFLGTKGFDAKDDFARVEGPPPARKRDHVRFGMPKGSGLAFFGDTTGAAELYHDGRRVLQVRNIMRKENV